MRNILRIFNDGRLLLSMFCLSFAEPGKPPAAPPEKPAGDNEEDEVFKDYGIENDDDKKHIRKLAASRDLFYRRRKRRETPPTPEKPEKKKDGGWNPMTDGD